MENIFDFMRAALPWIAMGLLLAIFSSPMGYSWLSSNIFINAEGSYTLTEDFV